MLALGELRKGIEGLADTERRAALLDWLEAELPIFFTGRILPVMHKWLTVGVAWWQQQDARFPPSTAYWRRPPHITA